MSICDVTITCGNCGETSPIDDWTSTEVLGDLPKDTYQCPVCGFAFRKTYGTPTVYDNGFVMPGKVRLEPVQGAL